MVASQPMGGEASGRQAQPASCPVQSGHIPHLVAVPCPKQVGSGDRDEPWTRSRDMLHALPLWDLK